MIDPDDDPQFKCSPEDSAHILRGRRSDREAALYAAETAIGAARAALQEAGSDHVEAATALLDLVTREHVRLFPPPGATRIIKRGKAGGRDPEGGCRR